MLLRDKNNEVVGFQIVFIEDEEDEEDEYDEYYDEEDYEEEELEDDDF